MLGSARIFGIWTERRSESLVKSLLKYRPEKVKVKNGDQTEIKDVKDVKVGDILMIAAGERIAVDAGTFADNGIEYGLRIGALSEFRKMLERRSCDSDDSG